MKSRVLATLSAGVSRRAVVSTLPVESTTPPSTLVPPMSMPIASESLTRVPRAVVRCSSKILWWRQCLLRALLDRRGRLRRRGGGLNGLLRRRDLLGRDLLPHGWAARRGGLGGGGG